MQPYVVRQGDYLAKIALRFGFDGDTVWSDPSNDDLRSQRPDRNLLFPGDVIYVPEPDDDGPPQHTLTTGATNTFTAPDVPTATVTVRFLRADGSAYQNRAYTVAEIGALGELAMTADGLATFPIPVTLSAVTLVFSDNGESWAFDVGAMDPLDTFSGVFKRLKNLGCLASNVLYDSDAPANNIDVIRGGLRVLKSLGDPAMLDEDSQGDRPPDSAPDGSEDVQDDAGLGDDGTLDEGTRKLLLDAHGC